MSVRLGVVGCGSVFWTPYMGLIEKLRGQGRVEVVAVYDADPGQAPRRRPRGSTSRPTCRTTPRVCAHPDVDVVLVLTSMTEHGRLARAGAGGRQARAGREAGRDDARRGRGGARGRRARARAPGLRAAHPALADLPGDARARARRRDRRAADRARRATAGPGPDWGRWFYEPGGGALFDLGVYNVTSLCGFFGPARRVTAMTGVAIPERDGRRRADARCRRRTTRTCCSTSATRASRSSRPASRCSSYRSPCLELYGTHGVLQMLGDDWAPEGYELWRNDRAAWELHPETDPAWPWTDGLRHLVECIETGRRAGHAARARLPRARDHARRAGRRRRRPRARDRQRLPGARPRAARRRRRGHRARARPAERAREPRRARCRRRPPRRARCSTGRR